MTLGHHTVRAYDEQLQQLTRLILEMGGEVNKMLSATRESFRSQDESRVADAKQADKHINELDEQIEDAAIVVLALQSPMAVDLRFVISVLKITAMLERAGDLAKNAIKRSVKMGSAISDEILRKLELMADVNVEMLDLALQAFSERDTFKATEVWRRDDEIDNLYHEVFTLTQQTMASKPAEALSATHIIFAAKNLERLADYTTNIAKTVYYITSGKRVDKAFLREQSESH